MDDIIYTVANYHGHKNGVSSDFKAAPMVPNQWIAIEYTKSQGIALEALYRALVDQRLLLSNNNMCGSRSAIYKTITCPKSRRSIDKNAHLVIQTPSAHTTYHCDYNPREAGSYMCVTPAFSIYCTKEV